MSRRAAPGRKKPDAAAAGAVRGATAAAPPAPGPAEPAADTRSRVLHVSRELIARRGNAAISLVEVAAAAGLSRQTLYLLFGSRAGLLLAMVEQIDHDSAGPVRLRGLRESLPPRDAFEPYLRAWFDYLPFVLPVARALSAAATTGDTDAANAWHSRMQRLRGGFLALARGLKAEGALRAGWTPEAAAEWMFGLTHVDLWHHLVVECGWKPITFVERVISQLRTSLIAPP
jgi:AcrR family transcriptional regulator